MQPVPFWKVPDFIRKFYSGTVWDYRTEKKEIFLTFDDGPAEDITFRVIEELGKYDAKATFFCIGRNVERHPDIYSALVEAGHATGNHTYSHVKGWYMSNRNYYEDVKLASHYIHSRLFRPPYGMLTPGQARELQKTYKIIMWSTLSVDYDASIPANRSLNHVISNAGSGSVVVFHDSVKASKKLLYMLPKVLDHFSGQGYTFETIR